MPDTETKEADQATTTHKNPVGRPSKYDEKTPEEWERLIEEYIGSCQDKLEPLYGKAGLTGYITHAKLPTVQGLCLHLGLAKSTIHLWAKEHTAFSDALERLNNEQAVRLINMGAGGQYQVGLANRLLAANHNMADRTENKNEHSGSVNVIPILGGLSMQPSNTQNS